MCGPFIHDIDPVALEIMGVYLWWYGICYALGFLGILWCFYRTGPGLGLDRRDAWSVTLLLMLTVMTGGRIVEVFFYEWSYYGSRPWHIPFYWLGGMSTHGLLVGGALGTGIFCRWKGVRFLAVADQLAIAAAWIMGLGRIANFIDGQIAGALTDVCWGVKFPDLDGFRHPVVLYDGIKNLMLLPLLLLIRRRAAPEGALFAHFVFWYASLRFLIDLLREYRVDVVFGLGTGQLINIGMALGGLALMAGVYRGGIGAGRGPERDRRPMPGRRPSAGQGIALIAGLLFCCLIPSDWTQDIPERYGERHPGLEYSALYPRIDEVETQ